MQPRYHEGHPSPTANVLPEQRTPAVSPLCRQCIWLGGWEGVRGAAPPHSGLSLTFALVFLPCVVLVRTQEAGIISIFSPQASSQLTNSVPSWNENWGWGHLGRRTYRETPSQPRAPKQVSAGCRLGGADQGLMFPDPREESSCAYLGHPDSPETPAPQAGTGQDAGTPPRDRFQPVPDGS